mmetsp:Transcript_19754/g.35818  ORF Transcript_19754/g.35818 Transcript_19754/m.35818 type:complete len:285 (-) Transcript_19754:74-928(-)
MQAAAWSGYGNAWQQQMPVSPGAAMHPKLYEAMYGDLRMRNSARSPDGRLSPSGVGSQGGVFPGGAMTRPELANPNARLLGADVIEEENPLFSSRGFPGMPRDFNSFEAARASGFTGDRNAWRQLELASQDPTMSGGALPTGDPCWVTVFGFPLRVAGLVRQQLEMLCGPIVEARHGDGNFMHIRFQTASAASQCLARNGHPLVGNLLVGCVPCTAAAGFGNDGADANASARRQRTGESLWLDWDGTGQRNLSGPALAAAGVGWTPRVRRQGFLWRVLDTVFNI